MTVKGVADTAVPVGVVTVMGPVTAPDGMTTVRIDADMLWSGSAIVPPISAGMVTCGVTPRLDPFIVTMAPIGPDCGAKLVIVGLVDPTVSGSVPDVAPVAVFCTAMVKLPAPRVAGPVREFALFAVSAALAIVHGVQAGPLMTMVALAGSKFVPLTVSENC